MDFDKIIYDAPWPRTGKRWSKERRRKLLDAGRKQYLDHRETFGKAYVLQYTSKSWDDNNAKALRCKLPFLIFKQKLSNIPSDFQEFLPTLELLIKQKARVVGDPFRWGLKKYVIVVKTNIFISWSTNAFNEFIKLKGFLQNDKWQWIYLIGAIFFFFVFLLIIVINLLSL